MNDGVGLSTSHISSPDAQARLTAYVGASLITITPEKYGGGVGGGKRGVVRGFTKNSRRRLLRQIGKLRRDTPALFVTLTYPAAFPGGKESKKHLDAWLHVLKRKYPKASAIWRLEYQERGAPHYHLLIFGVRFIPYKWVRKKWYRIAHNGDQYEGKAATQVKAVRSWRGVWWYASKYIAKESEIIPQDDPPGRFWGIHNRAELPLIEPTIMTITQGTYFTLRRYIRRLRKQRGGLQAKPTTERLFTDEPHRWLVLAMHEDSNPQIRDWIA